VQVNLTLTKANIIILLRRKGWLLLAAKVASMPRISLEIEGHYQYCFYCRWESKMEVDASLG